MWRYEYRWADNQLDRLPGLAAELVRPQVAVIVANVVAAQAAKAPPRPSTIPMLKANEPPWGMVASEPGKLDTVAHRKLTRKRILQHSQLKLCLRTEFQPLASRRRSSSAHAW